MAITLKHSQWERGTHNKDSSVSTLVYAAKLGEAYPQLQSDYDRHMKFKNISETFCQNLSRSGFKCAITGIPFKLKGGTVYKPSMLSHKQLKWSDNNGDFTWVSQPIKAILSDMTGKRRPFEDKIYPIEEQVLDTLVGLLKMGLPVNEFHDAYFTTQRVIRNIERR